MAICGLCLVLIIYSLGSVSAKEWDVDEVITLEPYHRKTYHFGILNQELDGTCYWEVVSLDPPESWFEISFKRNDIVYSQGTKNNSAGGQVKIPAGTDFSIVLKNPAYDLGNMTYSIKIRNVGNFENDEDDEGDFFKQQITWVGIIVAVVILLVVIFILYSKKRGTTSQAPQATEVQMKECPSCGTLNRPDTSFCEYCANKL
jgi:hypothetical protein